jgi:hypothetical protein
VILEEAVIMRSFLQTLLAVVTLGMVSLGCQSKTDTPAAPTDVTLNVPAMN